MMTANSNPLLASVAAFLVVYLVSWFVLERIRRHSKRQEVVAKIKERGTRQPQRHEEPVHTRGGLRIRMLEMFKFLGRRAASEESPDYPRARVRFMKAGLHSPHIVSVFWGIKLFLAFSLPVAFFVVHIALLGLFDPRWVLAGSFALAFVGFYVPDVWLRIKVARRKEKLARGLPDALDMLVVCVEAGLGLDSAVNRVAEEMKLTNTVLSHELKLLGLEMRAGKSREDALRNLGVRTDLEDVRNLVTLLIQTDKFGTSIAQALRVYSDSFRTKRYQRAEEMAAKLPVKLVIPLILFIFPSLFVAIMGPAAIRIYEALLHR